MAYLAAFDLFNRFLEGLIFLSLAVAFWQESTTRRVLAPVSGLVGIAVSFSSNISLTLYSLSWQALRVQVGI